MCFFCLAACVVTVSAHGRTLQECNDEYSTDQFTQAVDAALMELQAEKGWFHQLRADTGFTVAMSIASCTPDEDKWQYPPASKAVGVLARVLRDQKIRVAGVQWSVPGVADYKTHPLNPTGFWPEYMHAIADKIGAHYALNITVERVYYANSALVGDAVESSEVVDMSEPYYYLAGFHNSKPRIEALAHSCITAGTASHFYTLKTSGITSVDDLYDALVADESAIVGFIAKGNYDSVSALLPPSVAVIYLTNDTHIASKVRQGGVIAGYKSEGTPPDSDDFNVFETGVVSPRVALFHKDLLWSDCAAAGKTNTASPSPPSLPPPPPPVVSTQPAVTTAAGSVCHDPYSAEQLTQAVDAALMELQAQQGWFHNLRTSTGYTDAMSVSSCTPDGNKWSYPSASEAVGLLKRVLDSGTIKVAGVAWGPYAANPQSPTGFWPDYMNAIAETMAAHYGQAIAVKRVYYENSVLVVQAVESAVEVDMSEPYYYLGGYHESLPRMEALAFSCITAGTESHFYTNSDSSITSLEELYSHLESSSFRAVGFIGQGNFDAVSSILPTATQPLFFPNETEIVANVHGGALVAGYSSEGNPPEASSFHVFSTGIVSPRVALFHKDLLWSDCTAAGETNTLAIRDDRSFHDSAVLISLIVVASVTLVLSLTMSLIIFKERMGKPLFMPLITNHGTVNDTYTSTGVAVSTISSTGEMAKPAEDAL